MFLKPDIKLDRITEITPELLRKYGIKALILDVDNTLSTHHGTEIVAGFDKWKREMTEAGVKLTVLSNSVKKRIKPFAERIGLPFISGGAKPLPFGYIRAARSMGVKHRDTAIVGDQIFTDVIAGNLAGVRTFMVEKLHRREIWYVALKRIPEKLVRLIGRF